MNKLKYVFLLSLIGCGQNTDTIYIQKEIVTTPAAAVNEVLAVIDEENDYRSTSGQSLLNSGLNCSVYNVSGTTPSSIPNSLPTSSMNYTYRGEFNQAEASSLNILPVSWTQWFVVRCSGYIVITESQYLTLTLTSDDSSMLYIDNTLLIDNNGLHGTQAKSNFRLLRRGVHQFRLDYMQATGSMSLILKQDDSVISSNRFYK